MPVSALTLCMLGNFECFLSSSDYFRNQLFPKILSVIPSECQIVWIQTRPDMLGLICVQTVCKCYHMTIDTSRQRINVSTELSALKIIVVVSINFCVCFMSRHSTTQLYKLCTPQRRCHCHRIWHLLNQLHFLPKNPSLFDLILRSQ